MCSARPRPFLTGEWRYLVMLNYAIAPEVLASRLPKGTTLDLWQGLALVSVVGFRFLHTRLLGAPVPWHRDFDEVNLRFYVRRDLPGGEVRRGVTFHRELVPRRAIALVARLVYNEPYLALPMRSSTPAAATDAPGRVAYEWCTAAGWQSVAATACGAPSPLTPDSIEEFITEHYWGYTRQRDGGTVEYRVTHPRWRVWQADAAEMQADVAALYGDEFADALARSPHSAFIAEGSPIAVYRPLRLPLGAT